MEQSVPGAPVAATQSVARRLLRGSSVYTLTNFSVRALNFLLIALYTRYLTPGDYGIISLAEITGAAVASITGLGLDSALRRLYFHYKDDPQALRNYVSSVLRFGFVFVILAVVGAIVAGPSLMHRFAPTFVVPFFPYLALAIGSACTLQSLEYFFGLYQVQEQPRSVAKLSFLLFAATAVCVVVSVVVLRAGARGLLQGKLIGGLIVLAVAMALMRRWLTGEQKWKYIRETLPLALPLVPHQLLALGLVVADRLILERYRPLADVGVYSLAYTFGLVMFLLTSSLSQAWSPIFYDLARQESNRPMLARVFSSLVTLLTLIACFGACISQDFIRFFLDARYVSAGKLVPWIIGGYLFHALFSLYQQSAMQARKSHFIWVLSLAAVTVNIVLNLLWIPRWGMFGAAWATVAGYAIEALLMYFYAQRVFRIPYRGWRVTVELAIFGCVLWSKQIPWTVSTRPLMMLATFAIAAGLLLASASADIRNSIRLLVRKG